ncbi:aspartic peptidase domain-containing protein [Cyathus striatus]|nr:aspartic peptidase domain-containing protein [Cyathus striatus]
MRHSFSSILSILFVLGSVTSSNAVKLPFQKRAMGIRRAIGRPRHGAHAGKIESWTDTNFLAASEGESDNNEVGNFQNMRYTTNITLNGKEFIVALDTGSTDLWVISHDLGRYNDSGIELSLLYGDGTYGVNGTIGTAPFEFGPYTIEHQAFLHGNESTISGITDIGIQGLLGLGLNTRNASPIGDKIKAVEGNSATWGDSVLENLFRQHPDQPNFIGFDLVRTEDMEDSADGSFTIGEYDENYLDIQNSTKLPKFPKNSYRWSVLVDGVTINGKNISLVAVLDTGAPNDVVPNRVLDAIYSQFSGAVKYQNIWIVPCNATVTVEYSLNTQGSDDLGRDEFDMLLGDNFLRNAYSVYDFGDYEADGKLGNPYIQLLSKTNMDEAKDQFLSLIEKYNKEHPEDDVDDSTNSSVNGSEDNDDNSTTGRIVSNVASASDNEDTNSTVKKYAPVVLGLLAANLLVGLILIVLGVMSYIRKGKPSRSITPTYVPVKVRDEEFIQ